MAQTRDLPGFPSPVAADGYLIDAWQRSILFLDMMRRRAAQYEAHAPKRAARARLRGGARLRRPQARGPVNYLLARILRPRAS